VLRLLIIILKVILNRKHQNIDNGRLKYEL